MPNSKDRIMSARDVMEELNISHKQLMYLFEAGRLNEADFDMVRGRRLFREVDIPTIREALRSVGRKHTKVENKEAQGK